MTCKVYLRSATVILFALVTTVTAGFRTTDDAQTCTITVGTLETASAWILAAYPNPGTFKGSPGAYLSGVKCTDVGTTGCMLCTAAYTWKFKGNKGWVKLTNRTVYSSCKVDCGFTGKIVMNDQYVNFVQDTMYKIEYVWAEPQPYGCDIEQFGGDSSTVTVQEPQFI